MARHLILARQLKRAFGAEHSKRGSWGPFRRSSLRAISIRRFATNQGLLRQRRRQREVLDPLGLPSEPPIFASSRGGARRAFDAEGEHRRASARYAPRCDRSPPLPRESEPAARAPSDDFSCRLNSASTRECGPSATSISLPVHCHDDMYLGVELRSVERERAKLPGPGSARRACLAGSVGWLRLMDSGESGTAYGGAPGAWASVSDCRPAERPQRRSCALCSERLDSCCRMFHT